MSRQDKATTERHTRQLRELVKRADNKICADCKRNDPRWASWNIGAFLCIRCSGIHRGMGTHISKVKSIDLDTWTPEQMESITKWGNKRANLYWEAHLKQGHIPPDHKMESFIRSKYESRRWAMDGPPPLDPSVLEANMSRNPVSGSVPVQPPPHEQLTVTPPKAATVPLNVAPSPHHQPRVHQLLSAQHVRAKSIDPIASAAAPAPGDLLTSGNPVPNAKPNDDIFSLDFHAPAATASVSASQDAPKKDVKQDILSLFSTSTGTTSVAPQQTSSWAAAPFSTAPPPTAAPSLGFNAWTNVPPAQPSAWGQSVAPAAMDPASSGWTQSTVPRADTRATLPASQPWSQQGQPSANIFDTTDIWATSSTSTSGTDIWSSGQSGLVQQKKGSAFEDLWGGFK